VTTEVIYARVPAELKGAVEEHAAGRSLTLAGAVSELLVRGVEAVHGAPSVATTEARVTELARELAEARLAHQEETFRRQNAEQQHQLLQRAAQTWTTRANQPVGQCPSCTKVISGYDLFVSGQCPQCQHAVTSMLAPGEKSGLDQKELLVLLGAVGILLGVMAISRSK